MKKHTKLVAVLSATALLAIGASMTSFAATYNWQEAEGSWVCYDADNQRYESTWAKSGNDWYYLDEDGYMAVNKRIDDFYVGADGKMVKNDWFESAEDIDEGDPESPQSYWYYCSTDGKVVESGWKTINGASYYFDDYKMATGWKEIGDDFYYLGEEDDGAMKKGWQYLEPEEESVGDTPANDEEWYYFETTGKRVKSNIKKKIDGQYYAFNDKGVMQTGWVSEDSIEAMDPDDYNETSRKALDINNYTYFTESGARASKWLKVEKLTAADSTAWYYFKSGEAYSAAYKTASMSNSSAYGLKTIDGKTFCFDKDGVMKTGLIKASSSDATAGTFYFTEDSGSSEGSMKTGKINVYDEDLDETFTYYFSTKNANGLVKGQAVTGEQDNYYYSKETCKLMKADSDDKYMNAEGYLVNTSGKIMTASSSSKSKKADSYADKAGFKDFTDKNDNVYTVNKKGVVVAVNGIDEYDEALDNNAEIPVE